MKHIKEYRLQKDTIAPQTAYITKGADIVNLIDLGFDVALIVVCNYPEMQTELRTFKVCNLTEILYEDNIRYIGNFGEQHLVEIL